MKKIIISGITGFVGSNLSPYLKSNFDITGLSRNENLEKNILSFSSLTGKKLDEFFTFIHLAGKAHDIKKVSSEEDYFKVNFELTKTLFEKFIESKCEVFIFLSSVKAVADAFQGILDEDVLPNPITPYGKSKLAAEQFLLSQDLPENKKLYILRPGMIHGPNNKGNLNLLYNMVSKGIPYPLGNYSNKRSFLTVNNLCYIIEKLIINKPESGIYNVVDDNPLSTEELVEIIGEVTGKRVRIFSIPKGIIQGLALAGDFLKLPFNNERLEKLTENYVISNKKCVQALGTKLPYETRTGMKHTIQSFNS
ncbi:NAD-dependent epimerase/dehydratase family protein [Salinimicrobium gaetbulicola]|uniref:NAD-dependent epimerase/dehydratase family protein n=1 Tax=Salinimicrobium gaetbulicola TaxID=999702 RepID=A0ABW3IE26_9FLAO